MTDEQIKQKAEEYANKSRQYYLEVGCYEWICDAYIAGVHSRDEEIKELKERLEYADESIADADKWIAKYKLELDKLSNPWISVEERLPEKIKNKGVSNSVFVIWSDETRGEAYYNYEEYKAPRWEVKGAGITKPAYWMPIPEVKKVE